MVTLPELELSPVQRRVIGHDSGHLRIVACPGSGKTEVVSRRVANLIKNGVEPSKIVAFTFTHKAADELQLRIRRILEEQCPERSDFGDMYVGTIDSFCLHTIKQLRPKYQSFEVLDEPRQKAFISRWYYTMGFDSLEDEKTGKWRTIKKFIQSATMVMNEKIRLDDISNKDFVKCYAAYMDKLADEHFFDFTSIISALLGVLEHDPKARAQLNDTIKHVIFDEYQDVNLLQEELLERLSEGSGSVCVVGDDDQNIFQWRGSNIKHILDFEEKYERLHPVTERLDVNYRATDGLIETASKLISNNQSRVKKDMRPHDGQHRTFERGDIVHNHFGSDKEEFAYIFKTITELHGTDLVDKHGDTHALAYRDMAVLVRTNEDAARVAKFLTERKIECATDGGTSVFDRPIVSLALDCILFIFGHPGHTTGHDTPELDDLVDRYGDVLWRDMDDFEEALLRVKARADRVMANSNAGWLPDLGLQEFLQRILVAMGIEDREFGRADMHYLGVLSKAVEDFEYVYQTLRAKEVSDLKWFIENAGLDYSNPLHQTLMVDAVQIMTIWKAKGLEFPAVFVPSFVQKKRMIPEPRFVDDILYDKERYDGGVEDDRRVAYTAVTRSQKYLFVTGAEKVEITVNNPPRSGLKQHKFVGELMNGRVSKPARISKPKSEASQAAPHDVTFPTSYSDLHVYGRCPYDYKLRNVMNFSMGVPSAYGYGKSIHTILNLVHSDYIKEGRVPDRRDIERAFDEVFRLRFASSAQNERMKHNGIKVVHNYVETHKEDFGRMLETEKKFSFVMGNALVSGEIDLLNKANGDGEVIRVEIIDFKTNAYRDDEYSEHYAEQVRFYAHAIKTSLGRRPERALIHHIETQEKDEVDIGVAQLDGTVLRIKQKIGGIESEEFGPLPEEKKCARCDYRALCSYKQAKLGVDFEALKSERRDRSTRDYAGSANKPRDAQLNPPVVSENVRRKAEILSRNVMQNGDGTFAVPSNTDPGKAYTVTNYRCKCTGFQTHSYRYPDSESTCSHVEAVKIFLASRG